MFSLSSKDSSSSNRERTSSKEKVLLSRERTSSITSDKDATVSSPVQQSSMFSLSPSKDSGRSSNRERTSSITSDKDAAVSSPVQKSSTAKQRWGKIRVQVNITKQELAQEILDNISNPDPNTVMKLGHKCLESAFGRKAIDKKKLIHVGVLLMEWAVRANIELPNTAVKLLAKGHYEYWTLSGCECEDYNLIRSKTLYDESLKHIENVGDHRMLIDFCRVLQHSGEEERAVQMAMEIIKTFEHSPDYANYLFYTGCLYKSLGKHEQASTYLFESIQQGPPRYLSKLEMMFLISRNIEENAKQRGENCDDAYRMVFDHEKLEGRVSEELEYDGWINNSETWTILGDKCTLHGMFSIARDLYGQGLLRDESSFLKPKLWFSFAKACYRCGKTSDAQLAIKQALTMNPYNKQLINTIKNWSQPRNFFERKIDSGIGELLKEIPIEADTRHSSALLIQAVFKSYKTRRDVNLGVGKKRQDHEHFSSIKMRNFLGIIIEEKYPIVLEVLADYLGCIKYLLVHDVGSNNSSKLKLQKPFMPDLQMGPPRSMKAMLILKKNDNDQPNKQELTIIIRFMDKKTDEYLEIEAVLKYRILDCNTHDDHSIRIPLPGDKYLSLQLCQNDYQVCTTIVDIEISRNTFHWKDMLFMFRFYQDANTTNIALTQASSDKRILFTMKREHIDRHLKFNKTIKLMEHLIENHPTLAFMLLNTDRPTSDDVNNNYAIEYEYKRGHKKTIILNITKDPIGVVVQINDSTNIPIIGISFETVNDDALSAPYPPSRHKRRLREEASARSLASSQSRERSLEGSIDSFVSNQKFDDLIDLQPVDIEDKVEALVLGSNLDDDGSINTEKVLPQQSQTKEIEQASSKPLVGSKTAPAQDTPSTPGTPGTPATKRKLVIKKAPSKTKVDKLNKDEVVVTTESNFSQETIITRTDSKDLEQFPETTVDTRTFPTIEIITEESVIGTVTDNSAIDASSVVPESPSRKEALIKSKSKLASMKQQKVDAKKKRDLEISAENPKTSESVADSVSDEILIGENKTITEIMGTVTDLSCITTSSEDAQQPFLKPSEVVQRPFSKQSRSRKEAPVEPKTEAAEATTTPVQELEITIDSKITESSISETQSLQQDPVAPMKSPTKVNSRLEKMKSKKKAPSNAVAVDIESAPNNVEEEVKDVEKSIEIEETKAEVEEVSLTRPEPLQIQNTSETNASSSPSSPLPTALESLKTARSSHDASGRSPLVLGRKQSAKSGNFMEIQAKRMEAGNKIKERVQKALVLAHRCDVSEILAQKAKSAMNVYLGAIEEYETSQIFEAQEKEDEKKDQAALIIDESPPVAKKPKAADKHRRVIKMHYKPAISNKQKERLQKNQPFKVQDIPIDAFARAEKLVLALKELSSQKITLNDPTKIVPVEVTDAVTMIGINYGMDTNRVAAEDIIERNKEKARNLLQYMLANPASSRNNSAKRSNLSSRRSTHSAGENNNYVQWDNAFVEDPALIRPMSFNADKVGGYFDDRSSLYTTSVISPRKVLDVESSLNNPVSFLHDEPASVHPLYQESLHLYKSKGYINGSPTYAKLWKDKLDAFHFAHHDPAIVNKLLTTLMKINPMKVSIEEAYCSLADTGGSINEALGKLSSSSYVKEIQVVCTMTPIDQYLPSRFLSPPMSPIRSQLRSPSVMSIANSSIESDNRGTTLMKVHGNDAENKLPHYNMLQSSAAVLKRGAIINSMPRSPSSGTGNRSKQTSPITLPPINNANSSTNVVDFDNSIIDVTKSLLSMSILEAPPPNVLRSSSLSLLGDKKAAQRFSSAIDQIINENQSPIKVMTKRDAFKAHEDELLYKSNNIKFKKLSSIYKEEMKQYKKSNKQFW